MNKMEIIVYNKDSGEYLILNTDKIPKSKPPKKYSEQWAPRSTFVPGSYAHGELGHYVTNCVYKRYDESEALKEWLEESIEPIFLRKDNPGPQLDIEWYFELNSNGLMLPKPIFRLR
jgi:hypothetical protein